MADPYIAVSASDKTDDWPFWYVKDASGLNILKNGAFFGGKFDPEEIAKRKAGEMNAVYQHLSFGKLD